MAIAYWCILIAALLPYVWVFVAKTSGERYNNRNPRAWVAKQEGNYKVQRANAAHLNGFEAFPAFVAGVLMAQLAGVPANLVTPLAIGFVVARVLHGVFYLADLHTLRSLIWLVGMLCAVALIVLAALRVA
ncbi:MAG TPA: MAPEG family protein [Pseudoxanthomonas sp.]|uniref:MAPEG family protein n=1 Tax=Pseudoxanthomonas helianthi TaxID=1453541 RepID=A0A940X2W2_9GAMM|nr:MAPEG family protein [Pseudoxanthomonas helianthi]MBP3983749.1 MAPEG family protein [Pseudoxanthomonas helianthi]HWU70847.1 MAPEG family protein [Pseudoxanthomonas sp.]